MRARIFRPRWFTDPKLGSLSGDHFWLFLGITAIADREGRLYDVPPSIHGEVFPHRRNVNVDKLLAGLCRVGWVKRYRVGKYRYIQIRDFGIDQHVYKAEAQSIIPPPNIRKVPTRARKSSNSVGTKSQLSSGYSYSYSISNSKGRSRGEDCSHKKEEEENMKLASVDVKRRAARSAGEKSE